VNYRPHLDGIRAVAVVSVILYHLGYGWIPGGFLGVDVFFVLSGYLITGLLLDESVALGRVRVARFYARRMRRLLPGSFLVLLAVMVAAIHLLDAGQRQAVGHDVTAAALWSSNWRFATGGVEYFTPGDLPSPVLHYWSLAVEEQFYLAWPLLFTVLWRLTGRARDGGRRPRPGLLLAVVGGLTLLSAALSVLLVPSTAAYYGTHTRAYQLLVGAELALVAGWLRPRLSTARRSRVVASTVAGAAFAVLAWQAHRIPDARGYPGVAALVVTVTTAVLILAVDVAPVGAVARAVGHRLPAAVGRLSYSLYLWHWPVIVFAPLAADRWRFDLLRGRALPVAVMVAMAGASYLLVERPIRFRVWQRAPAPILVATGLAISLVVSVAGVPFLQPHAAFAARALEAGRDYARVGNCPYDRTEWGPPETSEPCVFRQGGPFVVALVGDSHAMQWQPAFEELAERSDLTLVRVTRKGCPANRLSVYTLDDLGLPHPDLACDEWRDRVYRRLISRFDPDLVFVATRSHDWGIRDGARDLDATDPAHLATWTRAWKPSLEILTAGKGKVVVTQILPVMPWRVPACLAERGRATKACDMELSRDARVVPYNAGLAQVTGQVAGAGVVDLSPIVCPGRVCPAMIGDVIVHRDDDHLSATFARSVADQFAARLRAAGVSL